MKKPLWEPTSERVAQSNIVRFIEHVNSLYGQKINDYEQLYKWSMDDKPRFWQTLWDYFGIIHSKPYEQVVVNFEDMMGSRWFVGAELNFAENLLRFRDDRTAVIFRSESGMRKSITYKDLYREVAKVANKLREIGIQPGDRVAGFMPNMIESIVAMLAATSIGAIWSSCSPDFGFKGVLDRFGQIEPKVLFTANGYFYNGKAHDSLERVKQVAEEITSIQQIVVVSYTQDNPDISNVPKAVHYNDFVCGSNEESILFQQMPSEHPVYIMYSSGTTGKPKCIVHGAIGTLIQHMKELVLHSDLKRDDVIFYFTTCGWMMWNWLISSLSVGATIVLFDGSPFSPEPDTLMKIAEEEGISIFGTSAKYLASLEQAGSKPKTKFALKPLRAVLSTGSPLSAESFEYVYRDIKEDVCLSSISGGTDIISCFVLGNPTGAVYKSEIQCRGLGMDVCAFDSNGQPVLGTKGELVCKSSFPSMPVFFWNDPGDNKYRDAYFSVYPNVWRHGDFVEITETGGMIIYGRSDATLNPGGVRIGTAEIYRQVETMPEIADSLVVGQNWNNDVRVILFLKLAPGNELTPELEKNIKSTIRANASPRHVPEKIIAIGDIPYTINGKKVEMAVRNIIHGEPVTNRDALANPQSLDLYKDLPQLQN